ncbi:MAG: hypothetical protein U1E42_16210 [Rhodospirillales bacterium]
MKRTATLLIDGKPYLWRDLLKMRREQLKKARRSSDNRRFLCSRMTGDSLRSVPPPDATHSRRSSRCWRGEGRDDESKRAASARAGRDHR